jgi:hypothetical protein
LGERTSHAGRPGSSSGEIAFLGYLSPMDAKQCSVG